jgi:hypothetical protein
LGQAEAKVVTPALVSLETRPWGLRGEEAIEIRQCARGWKEESPGGAALDFRWQ